jgi:hypothetical protein
LDQTWLWSASLPPIYLFHSSLDLIIIYPIA